MTIDVATIQKVKSHIGQKKILNVKTIVRILSYQIWDVLLTADIINQEIIQENQKQKTIVLNNYLLYKNTQR